MVASRLPVGCHQVARSPVARSPVVASGRQWSPGRQPGLRLWKKQEEYEDWEPGEGDPRITREWESARQHLAFMAYHETESGMVFIDRLHTCTNARRRGVATSMLRKVVDGRCSELQVKRNNTGARKLYEKEGYIRMEEGEQGEYEPQKGYQYMRRPESRMAQGETGEEIHIIECGSSNSVPRAAWTWMEEQIRDGDGATREQVQSILRPREERR